MKFLIVFTCLLAITYANENANVLKREQEVEPDRFHYVLELDNGVSLSQQGRLVGNDVWNVEGKFAYVSPEGENVDLAYTADENGYHPDPNNRYIHPIPEHIIRSIKYIQSHPKRS